MANYKVPQDVEADDKLIGPFNFRQFIYLFIVALAIGLGWGLSRIALPLSIIPLPVILFFGALALPLRKDQPMEIYMAAIVSFYLKPRRRMWEPDGIDSLIEITVPKIEEVILTKNLSKNEAQRRLSYLANIVDSRGWAVRNPGGIQVPNSAINTDVYFEAQQTSDMLDSDSAILRLMDDKLAKSTEMRHQQMVNLVSQPSHFTPTSISAPIFQPTPTVVQTPAFNQFPNPTPLISRENNINIEFNPYPEDMHQTIIQPLSEQNAIKPHDDTSEKPIPADIIKLANNTDLSIETIAREANRIKERQDSQEVVISLR